MISASQEWTRLRDIRFILRNRKDLIALVSEGRKRCGDYACCRLLGEEMYLLSDPDAIERVLHTNQDNYILGEPDWSPYVRALGRGLLYADGERHRWQRKLVQPAFQPSRVAAHAPRALEAIRSLEQRWQDRTDTVIDIHEDMLRLTLEVIARFVVSDITSDELRTIGNLSGRILTLSTELYFQPAGRFPWLPTSKQLEFRRLIRSYDEVLYGAIRRRKLSRSHHDDLLSILLGGETGKEKSSEHRTRTSEKDVRDLAIGLLSAGHETTANTLSWTWNLLAQNSDATSRLHSELDSVLGGRTATFEDLERLPYTGKIVSETLRLYPPLWLIARRAVNADVILGYRLPAGARVFMSTYIVHRDARWFKEPERFDPSRFDSPAVSTQPRFSYFPFGAGERRCVGQAFAEMTTQLIIANLAQQFSPREEPGESAVPDASFLRPRNGMRMRLVQRAKPDHGNC